MTPKSCRLHVYTGHGTLLVERPRLSCDRAVHSQSRHLLHEIGSAYLAAPQTARRLELSLQGCSIGILGSQNTEAYTGKLRQTIFKPQSNKQTIQARPTRNSTINSNNVLPFPHLKVRADAFPFFNPVLAHLVHGTQPSPQQIHPPILLSTPSNHFSSNSELWTRSLPFPSVSPPLLSGSIAKRRKRARALSSPRRVWVAGLGWLGRLSGERLRGRRLA
jgi:hypothetical protein